VKNIEIIEDHEIKDPVDQENKPKMLEYKKAYWEKNKDWINAKRRKSPCEKVYCDTCQFHVQKISLARHNKSVSHLNPHRGCRIDPEIEEKYPHFAEKLRREFRESQNKFYEEKEKVENENRFLEKTIRLI